MSATRQALAESRLLKVTAARAGRQRNWVTTFRRSTVGRTIIRRLPVRAKRWLRVGRRWQRSAVAQIRLRFEVETDAPPDAAYARSGIDNVARRRGERDAPTGGITGEHREAIVMPRGDRDVLNPGCFRESDPFPRIELHRVKR